MAPPCNGFEGTTRLSRSASLGEVAWLVLFTALALVALGTSLAEAGGDGDSSGGGENSGLFLFASSVLFLVMLVVGTGSACYIYVSFGIPRPNQLHVQGMLLLVMLPEHLLWMIQVRLFWSREHALAIWVEICAVLLYLARRLIFIRLIVLKVEAVGTQRRRWANIRWWGFWTRIVNTAGVLVGVVPTFGLRAWLIMRGGEVEDVEGVTGGRTWLTSLSNNLSVADQVALKVFFALQMVLAVMTSISILIFVLIAIRHFAGALQMMEKRNVQTGELYKVRSTLQQHLAAVLLSLPTFYCLMVGYVYTQLNSTAREVTALAVLPFAHTIDATGDTIGILLLSGIGTLVRREDPLAGDVHGRIRGLLHSAVLTSRAHVTFEGRVFSTPSRRCVVSFPGRFTSDWHAVTWHCEANQLSTACVFLPHSDPQQRFGKHEQNPETPGHCWCTSLYGEVRPWGCLWFTAWMENIQRAVSLHLDLVVVFFPGEAGQGIIDWDALGSSNLWDGVGLGGSQKSEVAYLRKEGISFLQEDLHDFRRRMHAELGLQAGSS